MAASITDNAILVREELPLSGRKAQRAVARRAVRDGQWIDKARGRAAEVIAGATSMWVGWTSWGKPAGDYTGPLADNFKEGIPFVHDALSVATQNPDATGKSLLVLGGALVADWILQRALDRLRPADPWEPEPRDVAIGYERQRAAGPLVLPAAQPDTGETPPESQPVQGGITRPGRL